MNKSLETLVGFGIPLMFPSTNFYIREDLLAMSRKEIQSQGCLLLNHINQLDKLAYYSNTFLERSNMYVDLNKLILYYNTSTR